MNEINAQQLQSIFGTVANIEKEVRSQQQLIEKTARILGGELPDITKHLTSLKDVKQVVDELIRTASKNTQTTVATGEKTVDELSKLNSSITSSNKEIEKSINNELNKYGTKQEETIDKLQTTLSSNFKTVSETFLTRSQDNKEDPFKTYIDNLITVIGGKLDNLASAVSTLKNNQTKPTSSRSDDTDTNNLLKRQIEVLERSKTSADKKLSAIFDAITNANQRTIAKERKEKTTPPEINLSRRDRKLLTSLDTGTKFDSLLREVKDSKKVDGKSPLLKLVSPLMLLLGGVGALAFSVFKFPSIKKMFDTFTKTSIGGDIMSFFKNLGPKNKNVKDIIRNIPFVGRMVDLWDALSLMNKGNYKAGFKQLAFAIPGAEYLALLLDTSKERLLASAYDKAGDKSLKIPFIGATVEQLFNGVSSGVTKVFEPVISFLRDGFGALGDVFNLLKKGAGINYSDVATSLDSITTNYFPALRPVADIFKSLAKSSFDWTASKLNITTTTSNAIKPINIGDMLSTVVKTISEKITTAFDSIKNIMSALGMVFSSDTSTQQRGLNLLDDYAPGLADSIGTFLNVIHSFKQAAGSDGKISMLDMIRTDISTTGPYSRLEREVVNIPKEKKPQYEQLVKNVKELKSQKNKQAELENIETWEGASVGEMIFGSDIGEFFGFKKRFKTKASKEQALRRSDQAIRSYRDTIVNQMGDVGIQELPIDNEIIKNNNLQFRPTTSTSLSPFARMQPGADRFQLQTDTYRGYLEKEKQETKQQIDVQEKLYQLINGPILNMLKESAFNSKAQVTHLEQTSKNIASIGNAPRNNVVVSSVKNSINSFTGSSTLNAKANALGVAGMTA